MTRLCAGGGGGGGLVKGNGGDLATLQLYRHVITHLHSLDHKALVVREEEKLPRLRVRDELQEIVIAGHGQHISHLEPTGTKGEKREINASRKNE